jgi:nickel-dependent lactate racemase
MDGKMELKYGEKSLPMTLQPVNLLGMIKADPAAVDSSPEELIRTALDGCQSLIEKIQPSENVVIVTSDITRYTGSEIYLPLLVERLNAAGVADSNITIVVALGIHRKQTDTEHKRIVGPLYGRIKVVDHECDDPGKLITVGVTTCGIEVSINRTVAEAQHLILTGTIGFHYFAGFGGGRKSILPGVASRAACMASHFNVLNPVEGSGRNGFAITGNLEHNPVHSAMVEACAMVKPAFILNTVLSPQKSIIGVFAGHWREAHEAGCRYYAENFAYPLQKPADLVVVSCGGFPKDINLIQAHKSMEYGSQALKDGGVMILLAECRDGYGNATFFNWFRYKDLPSFECRLRSHYEINGQTAYSLLQKALHFRIILVSTLPPEEVRTMQMIPAATLDDALQMAGEMLPEDFKAYVIPEGSTVLPVIKTGSGH